MVFISDVSRREGTSIEARVVGAPPKALRRPLRELASFAFREALSALAALLSLFMTSANALPTDERVIECLILTGGFAGRAAPPGVAGSAEGIIVSDKEKVRQKPGEHHKRPEPYRECEVVLWKVD